MKRKAIHCLTLLCSVVLPLACASAVSAEELEPFDTSAECSLSLSLIPENASDRPCTGAVVSLYRAADAEIGDGTVDFRYTEDFSGCTASLEDITDPVAALQIYNYAVENSLSSQEATSDQNGTVSFGTLETGLYLVAAVEVPEGFVQFDPFLIALPQADEGFWNYIVAAEPKMFFDTESNTMLRVRKVWEGDNGVHPANVTVRLMNDNGVFDTVTLSAENEWSYSWDSLSDEEHWYVVEENVPAGYTVSYADDGVEYIVKNTKTTVPPTTTTPGTPAKPSQPGSTTEKLFQTGQLNWPIPILAGGGMLLILVGVGVRGMRRKRVDEK